MRLGSWFGGILIAVAVATSVGGVTLARHHASGPPALTASRQAAAGAAFSPFNPVARPPHQNQPPNPPENPASPHPSAREAPAPRPPASQPSNQVHSTAQSL